MIESLEPNQIFVFGSNMRGAHLGGAARTAMQKFGAEYRVGEGLVGQSYAFPTLDEKMYKVSKSVLEYNRDQLYKCATENPDKEFLLTAVGTGIAGFKSSEMQALFKFPPANVKLPTEWL